MLWLVIIIIARWHGTLWRRTLWLVILGHYNGVLIARRRGTLWRRTLWLVILGHYDGGFNRFTSTVILHLNKHILLDGVEHYDGFSFTRGCWTLWRVITVHHEGFYFRFRKWNGSLNDNLSFSNWHLAFSNINWHLTFSI